MVRAPYSVERGRGSILTLVAALCPCARRFTPQKVLVIPRKRWLRPDMTEQLFTWMVSKNETKTWDHYDNVIFQVSVQYFCDW